ncbi:MAG: RIP metalloprotease RseP [Flavobacteriales bacterium]|nr:RIP metalloprotease RseP [Flavobacteriales bacterium]
MIQFLQFLLSLSILVVLHEFGHYITARMFGCRVEKFYLFMDWPYALFKKKIGDTEFGIGCAPLGGYVKISGFVDESMDDGGLEKEPEAWELRGKPAWQRLIVMLGGIIVNVVLAWFIYSMIAFSVGQKYIPIENLKDGFTFSEDAKRLGFEDGDQLVSMGGVVLKEFDPMMIMSGVLFEGETEIVVLRSGQKINLNIDKSIVNDIIKNLSQESPPLMEPNIKWIVGGVVESSVAEDAGLEVGDRIIFINDFNTIYYNNNVREYLLTQAGQNVVLTIDRLGKKYPVKVALGDDGFLGVIPSAGDYEKIKTFSFLKSFSAGFKKTKETIAMYWGQVKTIFNPATGAYKHLGGMITIGSMFPGEWNWLTFWSMTAFLSIILAVMNLLPIPALDGGHALIAFGEMLTGKKLPIKVLMPLQIVGMVILLMLVLYANGMDIVRLFN